MESSLTKFNKRYIIWLVFRLLRLVANYAVRSPFFRDIPEIGYEFSKGRLHSRKRVLYRTMMYGLLLECYSDIMRRRPRSGSKQVLFLMVEIIKSLDDFIDENASFSGLTTNRDYLNKYLELYSSAPNIMDFLKSSFEKHYDDYIILLENSREDACFENVQRVMEVDSVWLSYTMETVALFNGHSLSPEARDDFYKLGLIGKFADDMYDLPSDLRTNQVNLLHSLIRQNTAEKDCLYEAAKESKRLDVEWWLAHCPITIRKYFAFIDSYYSQISSSKIKLACDAVILRALAGQQYEFMQQQKDPFWVEA